VSEADPGVAPPRLSIRRRLACALVGFEIWAAVTEVSSADLDSFLDHMWQWLAVEGSTFQDWYSYDAPLLGALHANNAFPTEFESVCRQRAVDFKAVRSALVSLKNTVDGNLFGATDVSATESNFEAVASFFGSVGVTQPVESTFGRLSESDYERDAWGKQLSRAELATWRRSGSALVPRFDVEQWQRIDELLFRGSRIAALALLRDTRSEISTDPLPETTQLVFARWTHPRACSPDRFMVSLVGFWDGVYT
jgi:hypothetical protein